MKKLIELERWQVKTHWGWQRIEVAAGTLAVRAKALAVRQRGDLSVGRMMTGGIMSFVVLMFIIEFAPQFEDAVAGYAGTNTLVLALLSIAEWAIPIALLVGTIVAAWKYASGGSKS